MKKKKRLLSLCLGLVLVLGVSACEDLGDILGDQGSDEPDITTELEEGDGDNNKGNDDTSESNISYTYSVLITNEDELTPLVVEGDKVTAKVELVTTTHNRVTGDEESNSVDATAEDVVLQSSNAGVLEIEGLTINPIGAGTTTLTAYWSEHDATSSGVAITVSEPDSYTYELAINNKDSYTDLTTESTLEDVSITLTTYKNGVVDGTPETGSGETVSLVSTNKDVITVESGSLSLTIVGAGDTIITAYWIGHEDEESAKDTIAITISEPSSGGGEGTGEGGENPGGGEEPGGDEGGDTGGGTGDTGGDEGGGSGEGGGTGEGGDDDEPGGGEPETVYIETLTFNESTYELDLEENTTASFTVTALGPDNTTPSDPDAYSVEIDDTSVATVEDGVITAVAVGTTTIKATSTDNPTDPKYGEASITVTLGYEPVTSFSVSPETIELNVGSSVTLGYGENDDYKVSVTPTSATKTSFTLSGTTDEYLTISGIGTDNTYTISANDVDGAGAAVRTYTLTITSDDPNSTATKDISVVISEIPEVAHPVTSITLTGEVTASGDTYTKTISHTGSFTIGPTDSGANVIASVNEDAYDTSINVSSESQYISISGPDETTGIYTVTVVETEDAEHEATITIESAANPSVSTTLALTISRAEAYAYAVTVNPSEVTMLTSSTLIIGNDSTYSNLTVSVTNQYGEEVTDATWTAELTETSSEGVITSISYDTNTITINTGTVTGTGVITISVTGTELTATITVTVNQQYYDIDTITYSGGDVSLTYNLGSDPVGSTATISGENVTYSSTKGPVAAGTEADFALYSYDTAHISISEKTITALLPTEDAVTVYIYLASDPTVYTTISVTVTDITNYAVTSLELVDSTTGYAVETASIAVDYNGGSGSTSTSLSDLGISVKINPDYAKDQSYTITSSNTDVITIGTDNSITAHAVKEETSVTLTVSATDTTNSAYDTLVVTVTTDYVVATNVTLNQATLSKTEGDSAVQLTATVTGANGAEATDQSITWSSSNSSVATVTDTGLVSFVGAGSATITAKSTETETAYAECYVTVAEAPKFESYTVSVQILTSGNEPLAPTETYTVYLQTDYDNWAGDNNSSAHLMTYDSSSGYYSYTFYSLPTGTPSDNSYTFNIYHAKDGEISWTAFGSFNETITGSETGEIKISETISTNYAGWDEVYPAHSGTTNFYIVLFENASNLNIVSGFGALSGAAGDGDSYGYFGNNSTTSSTTSGYVNSTQAYVYNSTAGIADADHRSGFWFTFHESSSSWNNEKGITSIMTDDIPDTAEGTYAVFCAVINSDWDIWQAVWAGIDSIDTNTGWVTDVPDIDTFFSSYITAWVN